MRPSSPSELVMFVLKYVYVYLVASFALLSATSLSLTFPHSTTCLWTPALIGCSAACLGSDPASGLAGLRFFSCGTLSARAPGVFLLPEECQQAFLQAGSLSSGFRGVRCSDKKLVLKMISTFIFISCSGSSVCFAFKLCALLTILFRKLYISASFFLILILALASV